MTNPKRRKVEEEAANWSKLCLDLLLMVLKRLSAPDFERAKAVCSAWRSASREIVRKENRIPWLILFPYERSYGYSCRLLNPAEKSLVYRSRNLGVEFTQSRCVATCGSWLLMYVLHHRPKLYILNPLTREKINLPPLESRVNDMIISPQQYQYSDLMRCKLPLAGDRALKENIKNISSEEKIGLWVDEKSKDYLVLWTYMQSCLFFSKKGDEFWRVFPYVFAYYGVLDLVLKGHMLYIYTQVCFIEIFDFSLDSAHAVFSLSYAYLPRDLDPARIAVTTSGEVLRVSCCPIRTISCTFSICKMNHVTKTWDPITSLGDEALIFDLGITVPAKDIQGIKPDSIYFSGLDVGTNHIFIFNLATRKVEHPFMSSSTRKFFNAQWFIPNV